MPKVYLKLLPFIFPLMAQANCNYFPNAKECPQSGTTLLDDTYPAAAYVVSFHGNAYTKGEDELPSKFILSVLESYDFSKSAPPIIVPANQAEFARLKSQLKEKIAASNGKIPAKALDKVLHAPSEGYTWQQDYFESFVDLKTGAPKIRSISSYSRTPPNAVQKIADQGLACKIQKGPDLRSFASAASGYKENGEMGGNIEGLPGGLCLVGDNQSPEYTKQFCGKQDNIVNVDVSWLTVGHVDEIFKIVPTKRPGVPAECNFTLLAASPDKALELLSDPKSLTHPFFENEALDAKASMGELMDFRKSRSSNRVGMTMCEMYRNSIFPNRLEPKNKETPSDGAIRAFMNFQDLILSQAHADPFGGGYGYYGGGGCELDTVTNSEFRDAIVTSKHLRFNKLVQESINGSKDLITQKILERLPQCKSYLSVIDVPDLFYGTPVENEDGSTELARPGDAGSFMPNPTNSVISNNTLLISDPQSRVFKTYLSEEMSKNGLKSKFLDTWDYSHLGNGNLHCSTHSIPYCRPSKKGTK